MEAIPSNFNFTSVPVFSSVPIAKIPNYIFGNCNQATCHSYAPQYLLLMRKRAQEITHKDLMDACKGSEEKFIRKGEEFDWINGLNALEAEFMNGSSKCILTALNITAIMRYNGIFSRFSNAAPGEFRSGEIVWPKQDLDANMQIATLLFNEVLDEKFQKSPYEYFNSEDQSDQLLITGEWLVKNYQLMKLAGLEFEGDAKMVEGLKHLNLGEASQKWSKEQNREDGKVDIIQWFRSYYHFFPLANSLPNELEHSLEAFHNAKHPIEKACRIWFDIVKIHISNEANKRTGKALASIVLLSSGYLPPVIGPEDEKEYIKVMMDSMESKNGLEEFSQFVIKMMIKTYDSHSKGKIEL